MELQERIEKQKFNPKNLSDKWNTILSLCACVVAVIYNFIMLEYVQGIAWQNISKTKILANLFIIGTVLLIVFAISNSFKIAIVFLNGLFLVFALANYFVTLFRGSALLAADLFSLQTAANVASGYTYTLSNRCCVYIVTAILFSILVLFLGKNTLIKGKMRILTAVVAIAASITCYGVFVEYEGLNKTLKIKMYKPQESYAKHGTTLTFIHSIQFLSVDEPEGYSVQAVEDMAKEYVGTTGTEEENPNIIIIMNEAFSDYSAIGEIGVNEDYLPFYHSLTENTIKGQHFVPVWGGGTSNTEFEAITGNSMAFMPEGSNPYVNFIKSETFSMATSLGAQNYGKLLFMHPYKPSGYKRDKVYPLLGFDRFISRDDFDLDDSDSVKKVRKHISDESDYERIISEYESYKENSDEPFFMFNVTMQNHSPYDKFGKNLTKEITTEKDYGKDVNVFLNLMKESDNALKMLVEYFENQDEPTVILFFGDHQPRLYNNEFYKDIKSTYKLDSVYKSLAKFNTAFMIWANYDIEEQSNVLTSANYLSSMVSEVAGVKMSGYQQMVSEIRKEIPVITNRGYVGADGVFYKLNDKESPYYELILKYRYAQYNNLFDKKNRVDEFFEVK